MVERLVDSYLVSERRACRVLRVPRATYRYRSCLDPRTELRMRIREIAQARVRYGYRKIRVLLNREGWDVGKYLVYRLYAEEGLTLKRMKPAGKRKASRTREDRIKPTGPNEAWSMDFVMDQLQNGTRFRALTIVDVHTREAVAIEVGQSLKGDDVVRTLNRLKLIVVCRRCCSVTMAASSPVRQWTCGHIATARRSTFQDQASQPTMPSSKASTAPCDVNV